MLAGEFFFVGTAFCLKTRFYWDHQKLTRLATGRYQLRYCRYIGLAKTLLQHVITAAAINLSRMWDWWQDVPRSQTRVSRFARLAPTASS